ncbi:MAG TPA: GFA family protein [Caulobacteraceae bacterium]
MLTGGCLCGAVRYEASGEPFNSGVCHCVTCRRASGAPMAAWFSVRAEGFRLVSGALAEFASSDHAVRRFCPACGTQLLFDDSRYPDEIDISTASLDDPAAVPPTFHIWTRCRVPWVKLDDGLPVYPERTGSG